MLSSSPQMRKEVIFAILLGILLGGIIIYGTRIANEATQNNKPAATTVTPASKQDNPQTLDKPILKLFTPKHHSVSLIDNTILKGKTQTPNSPLAIISEKDNLIINSDDKGNFNTELNLIGGENTISISTPTKNNSIYETKLKLIYTTADLNTQKTSSQTTEKIELETPDATPASQAAEILAKVKAAIKNNLKQPHSTLIGLSGTVKSLGENTITLQDQDSIWQITLDEQTKILKSNKKVKAKNIPLDSKLIVIGNSDDEEVVSAIRVILVSSETPVQQRFSTLATITANNIDKNDNITLTNTDNETFKTNIDTDNLPKNRDINDLQEGTQIFAIIKSTKTKKQTIYTLLDFVTISADLPPTTATP